MQVYAAKLQKNWVYKQAIRITDEILTRYDFNKNLYFCE